MKLEEEKRAKKLEKRSFIQSDPILSQTFAQYYHLPRHLKQKNRLETKRIGMCFMIFLTCAYPIVVFN